MLETNDHRNQETNVQIRKTLKYHEVVILGINKYYLYDNNKRKKESLAVNNFHNACSQLSKFCVLLSFNQAGFVLSFTVPEESEKR